MAEGPPEISSLRIPGHPLYLATARLFVAAIGRQSGYEEETVNDLELAVSEACSHLMRSDPDAPRAIELVLQDGEGGLGVRIGRLDLRTAVVSQPDYEPTSSPEADLALEVIEALFADVEYSDTEPMISFKVGEPRRI